jgi:hypothetical protein
MHGQYGYINMQVLQHKQKLTSWATQIRMSRNHLDAFRLATHQPVAGGVLNAAKPLWQRDQQLARRQVEQNLEQRLDQMTPEEVHQNVYALQRCVQGHFPRLYARIRTISQIKN